MTGYLLSVKELNSGPEAQRLFEEAVQKLDVHRLEKVNGFKPGNARNEAVGAGLLLQLAAQKSQKPASWERTIWDEGVVFERLSLPDLLEQLGEPVQIAYRHGPHGKPDFPDRMGHFNLSHSEELVCAVFDRDDIGVDIQRMRLLQNMRLADRFFSKREREALESCVDPKMKARLFYRIWVKKESYAKLTGEGIATVVERDTFTLSQQVVWRECEIPEGYCMAVCQYRDEGISER